MPDREDAIIGCLLGAAVGDAVGLPCEGLSRGRQRRLFGRIDGPRLLCGRGMVSDDAEHAALTARALLVSGGDPARFARALAGELRTWLLTLPAGIGLATLRATLRLCAGVPPERSGVPSAGNGPAMRGAILGVCWGHDPERLRALVRAATRITHTDPRAERGTLAVAHAAFVASQVEEPAPDAFCRSLRALLGEEGDDLLALVEKAAASAAAGEATAAFADSLGPTGGISGYVYHTVPVALQAWFRYPLDCRAAVLAVVGCGGDTDTAAAITGGIVGAGVGEFGIPPEWLARLWAWPMTPEWLADLGCRLAADKPSGEPPQRLPFAARALRGALFTTLVLAHGFRRLLPPYGNGPVEDEEANEEERWAAMPMGPLVEMPFGLPGRVFGSPMPFGQFDWQHRVLDAYREEGVSVVVVLASEEECRERSGRDLLALYRKEGLTVIALPTEDFGVPPVEALMEAVDAALAHARAGRHVAVHCWAGLGRTGMFLATLAHRALGLAAPEAIAWVRGHIPGAVQTLAQEDRVAQAGKRWGQVPDVNTR